MRKNVFIYSEGTVILLLIQQLNLITVPWFPSRDNGRGRGHVHVGALRCAGDVVRFADWHGVQFPGG